MDSFGGCSSTSIRASQDFSFTQCSTHLWYICSLAGCWIRKHKRMVSPEKINRSVSCKVCQAKQASAHPVQPDEYYRWGCYEPGGGCPRGNVCGYCANQALSWCRRSVCVGEMEPPGSLASVFTLLETDPQYRTKGISDLTSRIASKKTKVCASPSARTAHQDGLRYAFVKSFVPSAHSFVLFAQLAQKDPRQGVLMTHEHPLARWTSHLSECHAFDGIPGRAHQCGK